MMRMRRTRIYNQHVTLQGQAQQSKGQALISYYFFVVVVVALEIL